MNDLNSPDASLIKEVQQLRSELAAIKKTNKKRTSALYKSEERFSLAMRGAMDGLWDWNIETNDIYYSPRWKSMLGYEENELDNTLDTWKNLIHPEDREPVLQAAHDYLSGKAQSFEIEMRMQHKNGHDVFVLSRAFLQKRQPGNKPVRLVGTHVDITERKRTADILEMIAVGHPAADIYNAIALMYEQRHSGLRCSMLELHGNKLLHGGAPSLPEEYCNAVHDLEYGPNVGSCGTSTYTGERVLVENIETDPKWEKIKHIALPHGMRCCWSEPIKNSSGKVLGSFAMYFNHTALPNQEQSNDLTTAARLAGIVMERDQSQKRIRALAFTDELTGLANRTRFYQVLNELIKISDNTKQRFSLLYIDMDGFKSINDSLGHDAGDLLLKSIAKRLQATSREIDFVARLSGDEFCIIVDENHGETTASKVAQSCLKAISQPLEITTRRLLPSCSIGIAHYPADGKDIPSLTKAADTSLYTAKERGKNQYAVYKSELAEAAKYRFQIEQSLREAIESQQINLVYQPQINIETGEFMGVEVLSRWHHPQLGNIPPSDFIPIAEKIGMIKPLTEWVLNTACHQAIAWKRQGLPALCMSVNISPKHFLDKGLTPLIQRILDKTDMVASELTLEVTESVVQTDDSNLSVFKELKNLGIQLAIDDFGTGYSSFASLKHLTVDCLKIDRYFINDMMDDSKSLLLVGSMIEMAHKLGYRIIAEGVETIEQLDTLKGLNCEAAQGYLFSKPVSPDDFSKLFHDASDN